MNVQVLVYHTMDLSEFRDTENIHISVILVSGPIRGSRHSNLDQEVQKNQKTTCFRGDTVRLRCWGVFDLCLLRQYW
jgi:hypothetical protein